MTLEGGPRIGVALGGGSARGLAHIPFIEAMDELGLHPSLIAGTSIGALIGAGWANRMTGKALRAHALEALADFPTIASRLWSTHTWDMRKLLVQGISLQLDSEDVVDAFLPQGFPRDFRDLRTPLNIVATDFWAWHQVVYDRGDLRPAIAASICVPSLFRPFKHDGRLLVDGGVVNPLPLDLASVETDLLIGNDVNGEPSPPVTSKLPSLLDIGLGATQIMMHQLTSQMLAAYPPDIYMRPHVQVVPPFEFWRVKEVIAAGEQDKERFKRQLGDAVDAFIAGRRRNA
jgi:NTE family protein